MDLESSVMLPLDGQARPGPKRATARRAGDGVGSRCPSLAFTGTSAQSATARNTGRGAGSLERARQRPLGLVRPALASGRASAGPNPSRRCPWPFSSPRPSMMPAAPLARAPCGNAVQVDRTYQGLLETLHLALERGVRAPDGRVVRRARDGGNAVDGSGRAVRALERRGGAEVTLGGSAGQTVSRGEKMTRGGGCWDLL
jgi:hypothetical protein